MRRPRVEWLILALALAATIWFTLRVAEPVAAEFSFGSTRSASPPGALALYRWLDALGYRVTRLEGRRPLPEPADGTVLWVLKQEFLAALDAGDEARRAEELTRWVEEGGTLIWLHGRSEVLEEALGSEPVDAGGRPEAALPWGELRPSEPWRSAIDALPPRAVPLLTDDDGALLGYYLPRGEGAIWMLADLPFLNFDLDDPANRALLIALVARLPEGATMLFDERESGGALPDDTARVGSLARLMRSQPWGWALYYGAAVIALWLVLRGRAFGRPLRPRESFQRREAGEFARSMGWLYQRTGQQSAVLRHLHARLRRRLIQRYRLSASLDDGALAETIARLRPGTDGAALAAHLRALQPARPPSDRALVALAQASDEWLARLEG